MKKKYQFYIFLLIVNDYSTYSDILNYTIMYRLKRKKEQKMVYIHNDRPPASERASEQTLI